MYILIYTLTLNRTNMYIFIYHETNLVFVCIVMQYICNTYVYMKLTVRPAHFCLLLMGPLDWYDDYTVLSSMSL